MGNTDSTEAAAAGTYRGVDDHTVQELVQQFAEHLSEKFDIDVNQVLDVDVFTSAPELPPHVPPVSSFMRYCMAAAQHDPVIAASRFRYVPGRISEERFWTGYISRLMHFCGSLETDEHDLISLETLHQSQHQQPDSTPSSGNVDSTSRDAPSTRDTPPQQKREDQLAEPTSTPKTKKKGKPKKSKHSKKSKKKRPSKAEDAASFEQVLLGVRECFVYTVPPRAHSAGYYAQRWNLETPLWVGRLRLVAAAEDTTSPLSDEHDNERGLHEDETECDGVMYVRLLDSKSGELFAQSAPIKVREIIEDPQSRSIESYIEPVLDSSRYFVIRFVDNATGNAAMLGIGFRDRSSAFDLHAALSDHIRRARRRLIQQPIDGSMEIITGDDTAEKKTHDITGPAATTTDRIDETDKNNGDAVESDDYDNDEHDDTNLITLSPPRSAD